MKTGLYLPTQLPAGWGGGEIFLRKAGQGGSGLLWVSQTPQDQARLGISLKRGRFPSASWSAP